MSQSRWFFSIAFTIFVVVVILNSGTAEAEPNADFSITSSKMIELGTHSWKVYVGEPIVFNAGTSTDAESYHWDFGDETTKETTTSTITHTYLYIETYPILLEVEDDEENTDTIEGVILAVEKPQAVLSIRDAVSGEDLGPTYTVDVGQEILLDGRESRGEIYSYSFGYDLENAFISQLTPDGPSTNHIYTHAGTYRTGIKVLDTMGNTSTSKKEEYITITVIGDSKSTSGNPVIPNEMIGIAVTLLVIIAVVMFLMNSRADRVTNSFETQKPSTPKRSPSTPLDLNRTYNSEEKQVVKNPDTNPKRFYQPIIEPASSQSPWDRHSEQVLRSGPKTLTSSHEIRKSPTTGSSYQPPSSNADHHRPVDAIHMADSSTRSDPRLRPRSDSPPFSPPQPRSSSGSSSQRSSSRSQSPPPSQTTSQPTSQSSSHNPSRPTSHPPPQSSSHNPSQPTSHNPSQPSSHNPSHSTSRSRPPHDP